MLGAVSRAYKNEVFHEKMHFVWCTSCLTCIKKNDNMMPMACEGPNPAFGCSKELLRVIIHPILYFLSYDIRNIRPY